MCFETYFCKTTAILFVISGVVSPSDDTPVIIEYEQQVMPTEPSKLSV